MYQAITAKNLLKPGSRQGLMSRACREPGFISRSVVYFLHKIVCGLMSRYGTCENNLLNAKLQLFALLLVATK